MRHNKTDWLQRVERSGRRFYIHYPENERGGLIFPTDESLGNIMDAVIKLPGYGGVESPMQDIIVDIRDCKESLALSDEWYCDKLAAIVYRYWATDKEFN